MKLKMSGNRINRRVRRIANQQARAIVRKVQAKVSHAIIGYDNQPLTYTLQPGVRQDHTGAMYRIARTAEGVSIMVPYVPVTTRYKTVVERGRAPRVVAIDEPLGTVRELTTPDWAR